MTNIPKNIPNIAQYLAPTANAQKGAGITPTSQTTIQDQVTISPEARFKQIVSDFSSIRNITAKDAAALSQNLYDNNLISLKEHAFLSFQPELNPAYNSEIAPLTGVPLTGDEPKDLVTHFKDSYEYKLKHGAPEEILKNSKMMLDLVRKIDAYQA